MQDRMPTLTKETFQAIHNATMQVLSKTGVAFHDDDALALFKHHGFRVEGKTVRFDENQVQNALAQAPSRFKVTARDPQKSVWIGENDWVFVPTSGAPFMIDPDGIRRPGRVQDYATICKLVQTSAHIDMNGYKHIEPQDVPAETAYLDMLLSNMVLCDKPFMGSADSRQAARDSLEMAGMLFGGKASLKGKPVMVGLINSLSPLQYPSEMAGAILELAAYRQPVMITNMIMGGSSGPVTLPALLMQMNAEVLAGVVLTQIAGPGTPVIYGTTSCPVNLRTGAAMVGAPETAVISSMAAQLARFYKLPCRTGGSLTDAGVPDAQAMAEGALILSTAVRSGAHFIIHACGMIGGYIGNSLEKWLVDEELCGMVRRMMTPLAFDASSLDPGIIDRVGIGGNYLLQPETLKKCRSAFFNHALFGQKPSADPSAKANATVIRAASELLAQRLENYTKPDIDPQLEVDLGRFVVYRKTGRRTSASLVAA